MTPPVLTVLFDGGCPMCRRTVRTLQRLDWLNHLRYADATDARLREHLAPGLSEEAVMREMYTVDARGARRAGYLGFLEIARLVPLLWPLRLFDFVPGVRRIGHAVYRRIAASRKRDGRCSDVLCS